MSSANSESLGGGRKKKKESKRIYRTSQNIRIIHIFLELLLSKSFPSLGVTVHLTNAFRHCADLWTCCGGSSDCNCSWVFLPPVSAAIRAGALSSVGALSGPLSVPQTQSPPSSSCGFNLQFTGRLGSPPLATPPWVSLVVLFPPLPFVPEAALEDLGLPL